MRCKDFCRKSFHPIESPVGPSNARANESVFRRGLFGVFKIAILEWSGFLGQKKLVIYSGLSPCPVTITDESLQGFPTKNGIILVVTGILGGESIQDILFDGLEILPNVGKHSKASWESAQPHPVAHVPFI